MDKGMMIIHKRLLTETPIQQYANEWMLRARDKEGFMSLQK